MTVFFISVYSGLALVIVCFASQKPRFFCCLKVSVGGPERVVWSRFSGYHDLSSLSILKV